MWNLFLPLLSLMVLRGVQMNEMNTSLLKEKSHFSTNLSLPSLIYGNRRERTANWDSNIDIQHINGSNIQTDKMLQFNKPALAISLSSSKSKPTEIRFEHFQFVPSPSAIEQHLQHQYQQPHRDKEATPKQKRYYIYNKVINYSTISNETQSNRRRSRSAMDKRTTDDFVSKNISLLLENLLKSYENSQLPTHGEETPTVVKTNILIRSMGPVSELDMDYSMDCYFRQYWRDKRLSFQAPFQSLSLSIKMLERIWRPDTYFHNGKHSHVHTITVPNKLLRLSQDGDILYSMRLTIKASCPMELKSFPMDRQSCPLILGSYAYTSQELVYQWQTQNDDSVNFVPGMTLSQFDLISFPQRNFTLTRREGDFSVLQVSFNLQRHTGYFLIQVYVPCILIVVLSWVSFWIHREATSDRVGLCITTVLTLSTISLDSRTDLPKVRYATALDWFLLMSFLYCIATLLEFAGVHYFTKVGSGEIPLDEDEWEDIDEPMEKIGNTIVNRHKNCIAEQNTQRTMSARRKSSLICPIHNDPAQGFKTQQQQQQQTKSNLSTMERTTQTEIPKVPRWKQLWLCFLGDEKFRKQRQREATTQAGTGRYVNSVSLIDRCARVMFPASFGALNLLYWLAYYTYQEDFKWKVFKGHQN